MTPPTILISTWSDGLFTLSGDTRQHEFPGQSVVGLAADGRGGALAIIDGHSLQRRSPSAAWQTLATSDKDLSCCVAARDMIYVGTNDARLLRLRAGAELEQLQGFDVTPGRDTWIAGTIVIDGKVLGPPLGVRSISATADGAVLLANVHIGGIPRSSDGGLTWEPTIAIDSDVHEVRGHPTRPEVVVAASAVGLCISRDAGATWVIEEAGLHAAYCSGVAFAGEDVLVAASKGHFDTKGSLYSRALDGPDPLTALNGRPEWLAGIVDTNCIAVSGATVAVADRECKLYLSANSGRSWSCLAADLPAPSAVLIV